MRTKTVGPAKSSAGAGGVSRAFATECITMFPVM